MIYKDIRDTKLKEISAKMFDLSKAFIHTQLAYLKPNIQLQ